MRYEVNISQEWSFKGFVEADNKDEAWDVAVEMSNDATPMDVEMKFVDEYIEVREVQR